MSKAEVQSRITKFSNELRKNKTKYEIELERELNIKGVIFQSQKVVLFENFGYIIDIYFKNKDGRRYGVEIDGRHHDYKVGYDNRRTELIMSKNITIVRFKNSDIYTDLSGVVAEIMKLNPVLDHSRAKNFNTAPQFFKDISSRPAPEIKGKLVDFGIYKLKLDDFIDFKKHKGKLVKEVLNDDPKYLVWMYYQVSYIDFDPLVLKFLQITPIKKPGINYGLHEKFLNSVSSYEGSVKKAMDESGVKVSKWRPKMKSKYNSR